MSTVNLYGMRKGLFLCEVLALYRKLIIEFVIYENSLSVFALCGFLLMLLYQ